MEVRNISITKSPNIENRIRLSGEVAYDDRTIPSEIYWFDVPEKYAEYLSGSGNPWLACMIPLAVTLGEPLRICKPVDQILFENVQELMRIWKCWHPHLHVISIEAELANTEHGDISSRTATLFSGGVDSFFTVLWHSDNLRLPGRINIDDLLFVWGFDVELDNVEAFRRTRDMLQRAASDLGKELIDVATNLRRTEWSQRTQWSQKTQWGLHSHGCALAGISLALERRYSKVLIPSTHRYDNLMPWGSHPLTDPLFSTKHTKIIHDGASYNRVEKTELVTKSEIAMRSLRVCSDSRSEKNCEVCGKCYRTMMTLMLLKALNRCSTFSESGFDVAKIAKIYSRDENSRAFLREVQTLALKRTRLDVARAIERSFKHSRRLDFWLKIAKWLNTKRFVGRLSKPLERRLLAKSLI